MWEEKRGNNVIMNSSIVNVDDIIHLLTKKHNFDLVFSQLDETIFSINSSYFRMHHSTQSALKLLVSLD